MTDTKFGLAYVQERWHALASLLSAEQLPLAWKIYSGGVAVGLSFASGESTDDLSDLLAWLSQSQPPQVHQ